MKRGLLQYEDLKEFKFEDWDGKPFFAFHTDSQTDFVVNTPDGEPVRPAKLVIGYSIYHGNCLWKTEDGLHWHYVYRLSDNEHFLHKRLTKRLTYRQLSRWLATGKGEFLNTETHYASSRSFYQDSKSDEEVSTNILVRTWDSEEWVQPTTKIIGELK